jgi:hypothetical protein
MAIKKSNVACVHWRNITQYDSGERCGPWASCLISWFTDPPTLISGESEKK